MHIGPIELNNRVLVAPMAGFTDRPFRQLCRRLGAGYAVGEMVNAKPALWHSPKSTRRTRHDGETGPIAVQLVGTDPAQMAAAALYQIDCGAQIIDINMGCPAKKVCHQWAGSALLQNEPLALAIIEAVVAVGAAHQVPVTLKLRSGSSPANRNAVGIARQAVAAGVQMIVVHGRTRQQGYRGQAEYDTVAAVKAAVSVPVVVNGDIGSAAQAQALLQQTGADAVMIGRAGLSRPWLYGDIAHLLASGTQRRPPRVALAARWLLEHLDEHYGFYGEDLGVRTARKHIAWVLAGLPAAGPCRAHLNTLESSRQQSQALSDFFDQLAQQTERWPDVPLTGSPDPLPLHPLHLN